MRASIEIVRLYFGTPEKKAKFMIKEGIFVRRNGEMIDDVLKQYLKELGVEVPVINQVRPGENPRNARLVAIKADGVEVIWPALDWRFQVVGDREKIVGLGWRKIESNPGGGVMYFGRREILRRFDELASLYMVFRP